MDLLQILNNILRTKNQIKVEIGENENLSRYSITIHNLLANEYNKGYRAGFYDRYLILASEERTVTGPMSPLEYKNDDRYYDSYTLEVLTDIMEDVLNYKLQIKDELNEYLEPDIDDNFREYPDYIQYLKDHIYEIGYNDGRDEADRVYEGNSLVEEPTPDFDDNYFTLTTSQADALLYYKLSPNGIETLYQGPVLLSTDEDVYYWAKIGKSNSDKTINIHCTIDPDGAKPFVSTPIIFQDENTVYISCGTNNSTIQYVVDNGEWRTYFGPVLVDPDSSLITARALRDSEYSGYNTVTLTHTSSDNKPANVRCDISDDGTTRTITLSTTTSGAEIYYSLDSNDGYDRLYTGPITTELNHFLLYTYSVKDGVFGTRLVYKWDKEDSITIPSDVQFLDEGNAITIYTTTSGARVFYRIGPTGNFIDGGSSVVSLNFSTKTELYAYCVWNGVESRNVIHYTYIPYGTTTKPPKPILSQNGNVITITSNYNVYYTTNQSDPRSGGMRYNPNIGIVIKEFTTIKAVNELNGVYSDISVGSFSYDSNSSGGESGSDIGGDNGTDTTELFVDGNWFYFTGSSGMTFTGTCLFCPQGARFWKSSSSNSIMGVDPSTKTYVKGNLSRINSFTEEATVGGDVCTIKGSDLGTQDIVYSNLFNSCTNLKNASGITINFSTMPASACKGMFTNCVSLTEANFEINTNTVSKNGFEETFLGCDRLVGGPRFTFTSVDDYGCSKMFKNCPKLSSTGNFALSSTGSNSFYQTFYNCAELSSITLSTDTGTGPINVFYETFYNCSSLDSGSGIHLNYSSLSTNSFTRMFYGCTSLSSFNSLPATTLSGSCYQEMFSGCSSLTTAPVINATTLATNCMNAMFKNCTSLRSAPELSVKNLYGFTNCYKEMFMNCSSLNYIKCLVDMSASAIRLGTYTQNWTLGVADSGTFEVNREATWYEDSQTIGVNGIPSGWSIVGVSPKNDISRIYEYNGFVYIETTSSDEIWYSISTTSYDENTSHFVKYTSPIQIFETSYVCAACKNEDGRFGNVSRQELSPSYPGLIIGCSNRVVTIYTSTDYEYTTIEYQVCEYQNTSHVLTNWSQYQSGGFSIDDDVTVIAVGKVNGVEKTRTSRDILCNVNSPVIEFLISHPGTSAITYWCLLSYPNPDVLDSLWYKINDTSVDESTIETTWNKYTGQFKLDAYLTDSTPYVTVTAIAKVNYRGEKVWSSAVNQHMNKGMSVGLSDPELRQITDSNNVVVVYENVEYRSWTNTAISIEYKFNLGGGVRTYTNMFSLADSGAPFSQNIDVYARARSGGVYTDWSKYTLYYDTEYVHFDLYNPEISKVWNNNNHTLTVYVTNSTTNPTYYTVQNYLWIEPTAWDATELRPSDNVYNGYVLYNSPVVVDSHLVRGTIHAYSVLHNDRADAEDVVFDISDYWDWQYREAPQISVRSSDLYVTITNPYNTTNEYYIEDPAWGTGAVDEHKYDSWRTFYDGGMYLDEHLASGIIHARYKYDGITSPESTKNYVNNNVQPLLAPTITVTWDRKKKIWILKLTNTANDGVILRYKIENCAWSGGVVDEHKYDYWKRAGIYGDSLSEYLISGKIIGQTYYEGQTKESEYNFVNDKYESLQVPEIIIVEGITTNNALKVYNKNPLATNWFRVVNPVWNPLQVDQHIYDNWSVCSKISNDIRDYLISGKIQAYSEWGSENTLDEIVEYDYDTGYVIDNDPPTISVTQVEGSSNLYTLTITNNAEFANYPRIKWMMDDIEWSGKEISENKYQYQGGGDYWLYYMSPVTIDSDEIIKGTIIAFGTDETNHLMVGERTEATTFTFPDDV